MSRREGRIPSGDGSADQLRRLALKKLEELLLRQFDQSHVHFDVNGLAELVDGGLLVQPPDPGLGFLLLDTILQGLRTLRLCRERKRMVS